MKTAIEEAAYKSLNELKIELPSWGFADTGTRFGKFFQDAAAGSVQEKFHDAGLVNQLTGTCPTIAVHVLWDFALGDDAKEVAKLARKNGVKIGSINTNHFQDQAYKLGSLASPFEAVRTLAHEHTLDSIEIGSEVGSKILTMWLADGTNYPGQDDIVRRKKVLKDMFKKTHQAMEKSWPGSTLLIEYKPFEPAFYHTDVADWGMSYVFCKHAGPRAKVLVDTGHHLPGANIEHVVAFLLDENMLGGFHFNDKKYADDDLEMASIDPYGMFRIFDQIAAHTHRTGKSPKIAYMVDQSHNLKPKLEAMVQTVCEAQKLFAKAHGVDRKKLADFQSRGDIVGAEMCLKDAFEADVTPVLRQWRKEKNLPADPLEELRSSGVVEKLGKQRVKAREEKGQLQQSSYA